MADDALECFEKRMQQEQQLQEQQDGSSGTLVASLVQQLSGALVYTDAGNAETNRRLWDRYAEAWSPQTEVGSCRWYSDCSHT